MYIYFILRSFEWSIKKSKHHFSFHQHRVYLRCTTRLPLMLHRAPSPFLFRQTVARPPSFSFPHRRCENLIVVVVIITAVGTAFNNRSQRPPSYPPRLHHYRHHHRYHHSRRRRCHGPRDPLLFLLFFSTTRSTKSSGRYSRHRRGGRLCQGSHRRRCRRRLQLQLRPLP